MTPLYEMSRNLTNTPFSRWG